jgi:GNAT superfamily N-acetyltransferase
VTDIRLLGAADAALLDAVAPDVFDDVVHPRWRAEFLADDRHHLAVAMEDGRVVGMASGVHYVHPDKAPELWINEVGVADSHRGRGLATRLVQVLLAHGRTLGCVQAWVLTSPENPAACRAYERAGGVVFGEPIVMYEFRLDGDGEDARSA